MNSRILTIFLAVGLVISSLLLLQRSAVFSLPGIQTGYEPDQPIAFSHRLHAGELGVSCLYCHIGTKLSRRAGIPPAQTCMNCHRFITAPWGAVVAENKTAEKNGRKPKRLVSPELQKIYDALGLDENMTRDSGLVANPMRWNKVHNLADFVVFDHRPHVAAGVSCQTCHGPVETMERMRQVNRLNMGWCINCHRRSNTEGILGKAVRAPTDCAACHY